MPWFWGGKRGAKSEMDKDARIKGERSGGWKEARGRGMIEAPSDLSPRNRDEAQRPLEPKALPI